MSTADPHRFSYHAMGTMWTISIWDAMDPGLLADIQRSIVKETETFDATYSRFTPTSLVSSLTTQRGVLAVPPDLVIMLRLYAQLNDLSGGAVNPLVGFTLSDLGYDNVRSLTPKAHVRPVPVFADALRIVDDEHIELMESVLMDLGAVGKGFFVDRLSSYLRRMGVRRFLVDGSGDIFYQGDGQSIRCGLEDPSDASKVIGVIEMHDGAFCASAGNRRRWGTYHHTIDPHTLTSPQHILATWVRADSAALADGLATCLFLTEPERYAKTFAFEYCILNDAHRVKRSTGFVVELY